MLHTMYTFRSFSNSRTLLPSRISFEEGGGGPLKLEVEGFVVICMPARLCPQTRAVGIGPTLSTVLSASGAGGVQNCQTDQLSLLPTSRQSPLRHPS